MTVFAFDREVTNTSLFQGEPPPKQPASEHEPTSMSDLIYMPPRVREKPRMMIVTVLDGPTRKFSLKKKFVIKLEHSEYGVIARHPSLPCSGHGRNTLKAIEEFCEMFEVQWSALVDSRVDELTAGAQRAREDFLEFAQPMDAD